MRLTRTVRTASEQENTQREKKETNKTKTRFRGREAGTGACEISPTLDALKETQNTQRRDIVAANAISCGKRRNTNGRWRQSLSPRPWGYEKGGGGTQGRRLGQTEASDNQCRSMRIKSPLTRPTVRRRKAKALRAFPPVSYERAKAVVERERKKGTRKRYEYLRWSLKRGRERSKEDARKGTRKCYEHFRRSLREGENGRKRTRYKRGRKARRQGG